MVVLQGSPNFTSRPAIRISPSAPIDPGCSEVLTRLGGSSEAVNPEIEPHAILSSDSCLTGRAEAVLNARSPHQKKLITRVASKRGPKKYTRCDPLESILCYTMLDHSARLPLRDVTAMNALFYSR